MHTRAVRILHRLSTFMIPVRMFCNVLWVHATRWKVWTRATRLPSQSSNFLGPRTAPMFRIPVPAEQNLFTPRYGTMLPTARRDTTYILSTACASIAVSVLAEPLRQTGTGTGYIVSDTHDGVPCFQEAVLKQSRSPGMKTVMHDRGTSSISSTNYNKRAIPI